MKIAVIGAGITGLTAAFRLSQKGHQVIIFEKEKFAGGLASGFKEKVWQWDLESFYHHLFTTDKAAKKLLEELDLGKKVFYTRPKTSIFYKNQISQFDSPLSVLKFPHLSFFEKIRTALVTSYLRTKSDWKDLEKITAAKWLKKYYGNNTYKILWQPLLLSKFGSEAEKVSMSWFWARIKKRSFSLGYLEGGFQRLTDNLLEGIKTRNGEIRFGQEIEKFDQLKEFDKIIFTTPASAFLKIIPDLPKSYQNKLQQLQMIGTISLTLSLKKKFLTDNTYWLNINDQNFPFVAVVEHTNFIDKKNYGGNHILYVGGYYPQNHKYFKMTQEKILAEFLPFLQKINPQFNFKLLTSHFFLSTSLTAQPVVPINYSKLIPPFQTPLPNVYLANIQQVYPWDRGINYAVELGEKIAHEIFKS